MYDINVNPGDLNKKIEIWRPRKNGDPVKTDPDGFVIDDDVKIRTCWSKFTQQSGKEILEAGTEFAEVKTRFLVRYSKKHPIDTDMYVLYAGSRYDIEYINSYGDSKQYTEIWCKKRGRS